MSEFHVEGIAKAKAAAERTSNGLEFFVLHITGDGTAAPARATWKRLTEKAFTNPDEAGAWLHEHAARLIREEVVAVRVMRVVSMHLLRPAITLPLATPAAVAELTAAPPTPAITFGPVVEGDEWKHDVDNSTEDDDE